MPFASETVDWAPMSDGDVAVTRNAAERCALYVDGPYRFEVLEGVTHWIPTQAPAALAGLVLDRIGRPVT